MTPTDSYNFYCLTDNDNVKLKDRGIHKKLPYVFIQNGYSFNDVMSSSEPGRTHMLYLERFNDKYSIHTFKRIKTSMYNISLQMNATKLSEKTCLKLQLKVTYFNQLIFNAREMCKNEVPEDVIKYLLKFIIS